MVFGALLFGAELMLVDLEFYLFFLGAAAIIVGVLDLTMPGMPVWVEWLAFGALALASMVFFRRRVYSRIRGGGPGLAEPLVNDTIIIAEGLAPGARCRVEHRGSAWTAVNAGQAAIAAGGQARVVKVESLTLHVTPAGPQG